MARDEPTDRAEAVQAGVVSGRGRWLAALVALTFLAVVGVLVVIVIRLTAADPLAIDGEIVETITDSCEWHLEIPLRNNGDNAVTVAKVEVLIDGRRVPFLRPAEMFDLQPGERTRLGLSRPITPCPATPGDVKHDRLWVSWRDFGPPGHVEIVKHSF